MSDIYITTSFRKSNGTRINHPVGNRGSVQSPLCEAFEVISGKKSKLPREFFQKIGKMGGLAGAGSEAKRASAIKAAQERWRIHREQTPSKPLTLEVRGNRVWTSENVPGLRKPLTGTHAYREEGKAIVIRRKTCFLEDQSNSTQHFPLQLLSRVENYLNSKEIPYQVKWVDSRPKVEPSYPQKIQAREARLVNRLLRQPCGGIAMLPNMQKEVVELIMPPRPKLTKLHARLKKAARKKWRSECRQTKESHDESIRNCPTLAQKIRIIASLIKSFRYKTLIVVQGEAAAREMFVKLKDPKEADISNLGLVVGNVCDHGDVVVVSAASFIIDDLPLGERDLVIMSEIPLKGLKEIERIMTMFPTAIKYGFIGGQNRTQTNLLLIELAFGAIVKLEA